MYSKDTSVYFLFFSFTLPVARDWTWLAEPEVREGKKEKHEKTASTFIFIFKIFSNHPYPRQENVM